MKEIRKIVHIDAEKCNGCGLCVPACHEGAIQVIDGKARLLEDFLCDGLGDCLGECPEGAIHIEEREADSFDEEAVQQHLQQRQEGRKPVGCGEAMVIGEGEGEAVREKEGKGNWKGKGDANDRPLPCGCPGSSVVDRRHIPLPREDAGKPGGEAAVSRLRQWPVQAALVPSRAPFLQGDRLLVTADCVPFAMADYHERLLQGNPVLVGCPKLDDAGRYVEKFAAVLKENDIREVTVAFMEVPCCGGMVRILQQAIQESGKDVVLKGVKVSTTGEVLQEGRFR